MEHILPGGIGTYSISHISYFNQRVPKPEGTAFPAAQASSNERNDENSNCSSYTGSGFTLWEESTLKKGKTGKENAGERPILRGKFLFCCFNFFALCSMVSICLEILMHEHYTYFRWKIPRFGYHSFLLHVHAKASHQKVTHVKKVALSDLIYEFVRSCL